MLWNLKQLSLAKYSMKATKDMFKQRKLKSPQRQVGKHMFFKMIQKAFQNIQRHLWSKMTRTNWKAWRGDEKS